jgi:TonB family protein
MTPRLIPLAVVLAATAVACSKTESPPPKPAQAGAAKAFTPNVSTELDEGAKDRIARREAATRMLEKNVLEPTPPRAPDPPAAAKVPEPAPTKTVPAPRPDAVVEAPKPAPAAVTAPPVAAPTPAPAPAVQPPAPKTDLAAATTSAPVRETAPRLVSRVDPDFPREATQAGVDQGMVKARMTLDAAGGVTRVEIVEANPRRIFDRAVVRALSLWRYNAGSEGRMVEMEVAFKR